MFGLNVFLFFLNVMLRYYILRFKDEDLEFVRKMIESFYVDDLVIGEDDMIKVFFLYVKFKNRMVCGGFKL